MTPQIIEPRDARIDIRIPRDLKQSLDSFCRTHHRRISDVIVDIILQITARQEPLHTEEGQSDKKWSRSEKAVEGRIHVKVPKSLKARLADLCAESEPNVTMSRVIVSAIEHRIRNGSHSRAGSIQY